MRQIFTIALLLAACTKDEPADRDKKSDTPDDKSDKADKKAEADPEDNAKRTYVLDAWKQGGLSPSRLTATKVDVGKDCRSGTIDGVDVLVCVYGSPDEAKAAEKPGLAWIGATTGAAQAHGAVLIAAADRARADPNGKTINQIMKLAAR
ncbi:MAG: hypothetical protein KF773_07365 [Deltaproteobacteria bacterium]|nr:hypothetical protein [Deltaproteobacteria bacterium]